MKTPRSGPAPIDPALTYPLATFKAISGMGDNALRRARRQGLRVLNSGRQAYVTGADFIAFLAASGSDAKPGSASERQCQQTIGP
jgi:hypothetical protein